MRHVKEATHLLECVHSTGSWRKRYSMPCILLSENKSKGTARVLVFGDRFWMGSDHIQKTRTVPMSRLVKIGEEP